MINPKHIAIILDGNGRWAEKRGKARTQGHVEGAKTLKKIIQTIQNKDIDVVSLFVFSTENWKRPSKEVDFLMSLPKRFEKDIDDLSKNEDGIQVVFSGRKDRLSEPNKLLIDKYVMQSEMNQGLTVNVCLDYGFKDEMVHVAKTLAKKVKEGALDISEIDETMIDESLYTHPLPPVDLVIRTSGEQRLSNFLLWQSAYAEIYFTETLWPDFDEEALEKALTFYQSRTRRFGKVDYE
jgi:undecaprenyl diphosphate synthase